MCHCNDDTCHPWDGCLPIDFLETNFGNWGTAHLCVCTLALAGFDLMFFVVDCAHTGFEQENNLQQYTI